MGRTPSRLSSPSCPSRLVRMLHRFTVCVAASTVVLLLAGSLVTSTGSGLAVPDWPTTYGENMFTFPPSKWVGGIFYEHGHRLIASSVGFLTIILAIWLWLADPRPWMKRLGVMALAAVIVQGILGGITVLFFLPAAISTAHAGLAEIFFGLTVAIALFTSPGWTSATRGDAPTPAVSADAALRRVATATSAVIYLQILVGAVMRHTEAGLAIPDFPLMFGSVIPDHWDGRIAVHFAHRVGALVVTVFVVATCLQIRSRRARAVDESNQRALSRAAALIAVLVVVQIALGGLTVLTERAVWVNSLHLVCGALVLATSVVITLRSWRGRFVDAAEPTGTDAILRGVQGAPPLDPLGASRA